MNLNDYTRHDLVAVLEKLKKEYPAVYRSFILMELSYEEYEKEQERIYGPYKTHEE